MTWTLLAAWPGATATTRSSNPFSNGSRIPHWMLDCAILTNGLRSSITPVSRATIPSNDQVLQATRSKSIRDLNFLSKTRDRKTYEDSVRYALSGRDGCEPASDRQE